MLTNEGIPESVLCQMEQNMMDWIENTRQSVTEKVKDKPTDLLLETHEAAARQHDEAARLIPAAEAAMMKAQAAGVDTGEEEVWRELTYRDIMGHIITEAIEGVLAGRGTPMPGGKV